MNSEELRITEMLMFVLAGRIAPEPARVGAAREKCAIPPVLGPLFSARLASTFGPPGKVVKLVRAVPAGAITDGTMASRMAGEASGEAPTANSTDLGWA